MTTSIMFNKAELAVIRLALHKLAITSRRRAADSEQGIGASYDPEAVSGWLSNAHTAERVLDRLHAEVAQQPEAVQESTVT